MYFVVFYLYYQSRVCSFRKDPGETPQRSALTCVLSWWKGPDWRAETTPAFTGVRKRRGRPFAGAI